jgi:DNA-binding NarL/FixJ family response regulator
VFSTKPNLETVIMETGTILGGGGVTQSILLVDDNVFNRDGVRLYLSRKDFDILEAGDEATAWQLAQDHTFIAAVVDISIPPDPETPIRSEHSFGIRLARRLKKSQPTLGIVLFSAYEDRGADVLDMVQEGVRGMAYKLKGSHPDTLLQAIHDVIAGRVVIDPDVHANRPELAEQLFERLTPDEKNWVQYALQNFDDLTPREKEIAHRVAAAHNTQNIAQALTLTPKTVENYTGRVYDKLGFSEIAAETTGLRKAVLLAKVCMLQDLRSD